MTTIDQIASSALWAITALASIVALALLIQWWMGSPTRDRQDDERLLGKFTNARDLSAEEIGDLARLGKGRLYPAIARLESLRLLDGYWQGESPDLDRVGASPTTPRTRRYALTSLGREEVRAIERRKIEAG